MHVASEQELDEQRFAGSSHIKVELGIEGTYDEREAERFARNIVEGEVISSRHMQTWVTDGNPVHYIEVTYLRYW